MQIIIYYIIQMIMAKKYRYNRGDSRYDIPKIVYFIQPIYDIKWIVKEIRKIAPYS